MLAGIKQAIVAQATAKPRRHPPGREAASGLRKEAAAEFGRINGWRVASWFPVRRIGCATKGNDYGGDYLSLAWADHPIHYRAPRADDRRGWMNVAIVGQPYADRSGVAEALDALRAQGFAVHLPPRPRASIHYPGWTRFIVVTQPGVSVTWLPEQMGA